MARPQKEGLDYFPHDTVTDEKVEAMEARYGLAGHAFYFKLCERIYRTNDGELDVSDAETRRIIARSFHINLKHFEEMLAFSVEKQLFSQELFRNSQKLSSSGIQKRRESVNGKRELMRLKYHQAKLKSAISDAETKQEQNVSDAETNSFCRISDHKGKERKEKERKGIIPPVPPQPDKPAAAAAKGKAPKNLRATTEAEFLEYVQETKNQFPDLDCEVEFKKFTLWWSEGKRKLTRPKTAFFNWLTKAREIAAQSGRNGEQGGVNHGARAKLYSNIPGEDD